MKIKDILKNARLSISPTKLKVLLKPSIEKILVSFILFLLPILPFILYLGYGDLHPILGLILAIHAFLFNSPLTFMGFFSAEVFPIAVSILCLIAYFFGSYIVEKKSWIKGLVFYIVSLWIVGIIAMTIIGAYNDAFGHSCQTDEDCIFICGAGTVNKHYIYLRDPFLIIDCSDVYPICENNRCTGINIFEPPSESDCERVKNDYMQSRCYYSLSDLLKKEELCEKIKEVNLQSRCYYNLAENSDKFRNEKTCEKIKSEEVRERCYILIQNEGAKGT